MGMSHAYGTPSSRQEAEELLGKALDLGCTFFDTAEVYGTADDPHHNERLLGEILKPYRNQIKIASKCGIRFDETATTVNKPLIPDGRPETIKKSIDGTLARLKTDHLDLYYIHRIDTKVPIEETAGAMKELMEEGKILHWGLSEATEDVIRRAHKVCPLTAIQNRYSMMYRDYEELFPVLEELNIKIQGKITDSGKEVWGSTHPAPQAVVLESRGIMQNFVPSVVGMGAKDAVYLLESKGLKVNLVGVGKVKSQSIANGSVVKKGQTITLTMH